MGRYSVYFRAAILLCLCPSAALAGGDAVASATQNAGSAEAFAPPESKVMPVNAPSTAPVLVEKKQDAQGFYPPENHEPQMAQPETPPASAPVMLEKKDGAFAPTPPSAR